MLWKLCRGTRANSMAETSLTEIRVLIAACRLPPAACRLPPADAGSDGTLWR